MDEQNNPIAKGTLYQQTENLITRVESCGGFEPGGGIRRCDTGTELVQDS